MDATKLATRLLDFKDKGAPSLEVATKLGRAGVSVFVTGSDVDPDAIFGSASSEGSQPSPLLNPSPGRAWVKLRMQADAARTVDGSPAAGKFKLLGKAGLGFGVYLPADASTTLADVLRKCVDLPLVLEAADMGRLAPGQAAYLALAGTLSATLQFHWADVLTGEIMPLRGLVPDGKPLNLAVDLKAGFAAAITISDSFRLVFSGVDADYVAVSLNRASSDGLTVKAGATATIRLEKPDMARGLLARLCAQLLGLPPERIGAAREQLEALLNFYDNAIKAIRDQLGELAGRIDALLDAEGLPVLLTRLQQLQAVLRLTAGVGSESNGLAPSIGEMSKAVKLLDGLAVDMAANIGDQLDDVLAAWHLPALATNAIGAARGLLERIQELETALTLMARKRIERGLDFEYRRIATDASVLKALLRRNHTDFAQWHRALVGLDAKRLLTASSPTNRNVVLELFLNHKSIRRSVSLGLNLGKFYSDKDSAQAQWTESTRRVAGAGPAPRTTHRLALMGSRSREEKVLGTRARCGGQFDADFATRDGEGRSGHWDFELALAYASETPKADRRWLLALADYACVWGVIGEPDIEGLVRTLEEDGAIGGKVEMECALTIERAAFADPAFVEAVAAVPDADACAALAVGLQRMEPFTERCTPTSRKATYADAMTVLLGKQGIDAARTDAVARFVSRRLRNASRELKAFEGIGARPLPAGSVAWLTQHTGSAMAALRQLKELGALGRLAGSECHGSAEERKLVSAAFSGLDLGWRDRYLLRWQVTLLRDIAIRAGMTAATRSTLKVTVGASGNSRIITPAAWSEPYSTGTAEK